MAADQNGEDGSHVIENYQLIRLGGVYKGKVVIHAVLLMLEES